MGSLGHVVVGAALAAVHDALDDADDDAADDAHGGAQHHPTQKRPAARKLKRTLLRFVWFPALAMVPDLDVIGFRFGVAYADEWGHRGASHSIVFALVLAAAVSVPTARGLSTKLLPTWLLVTLALLSHGFIDALTDGGLGPALLWPFDDARVFFSWRPLPVAPIGRAFLSARGLRCAVIEIVAFVPVLLGALWWRRRRRTR